MVEDSGIGISQEHLDRLFDRFYRTDKARSRDKGGTGLGLAVVKSILNAHGTDIQVESEVGKGTSFWFTLPAKI
jgi:signal transduction histidine kinase